MHGVGIARPVHRVAEQRDGLKHGMKAQAVADIVPDAGAAKQRRRLDRAACHEQSVRLYFHLSSIADRADPPPSVDAGNAHRTRPGHQLAARTLELRDECLAHRLLASADIVEQPGRLHAIPA